MLGLKLILFGGILFLCSKSMALPFDSVNPRAWALGGSGIASANSAHALNFNPALLSSRNTKKGNQLILQLGVRILDNDNLINSIDDFIDQDFINAFENSVENAENSIESITDVFDELNSAIIQEDLIRLTLNKNTLSNQFDTLTTELDNIFSKTDDVISELDALSNQEVLANTGVFLGTANPGESFGWGLFYNRNTTLSGILTLSQRDVDLLNLYTLAHQNFGELSEEFLESAILATNNLELINQALESGDISTIDSLRMDLRDSQNLLQAAEQSISTFNFSEDDLPQNSSEAKRTIFENGDLVESAKNPDFESAARFIGIDLEEFGVSLSREFNLSGFVFSVGVTPKLQKIEVFDFVYEVDDEEDFDIDELIDTGISFNDINFDLGFSKTLGQQNQYELGLVARNLIPRSYETINQNEIEFNPLLRIGAAYNHQNFLISGDLDLTKNQGIGFETPTQYLGFGAEFIVNKALKFRSGYRTNLEESEDSLYSLGLGTSIWATHIDLAIFSGVNRTENNAGIALELGYSW